VTVEQLEKHARRFGTEGVMVTAIEAGLSFEGLVRLQTTLDEIEAAARRYPKRTRKTAEQKVRKLLGIEEEPSAAL